jgi:adenylosuccinate synthase
MERSGLRFADIFYPDVFRKILKKNIEGKNELIETFYGAEAFDVDQTVEEVMAALEQLKPYVVDTVELLQEAKKADKKILLEGAQGTLLDIDFGTYPYVTSSHPTTGGVSIGTGLSPFDLDGAIGVVKAYTTRVGKGPFPTELENETGEWIREKGFEFGTTTGRARRCGWLDTVILKYTAQINGLTSLVVTKLDTLGGLDQLEICSGYMLNGKLVTTFPASLQTLALCEPVYETHPGWSLEEMVDVKTYEDLPENAKKYLARIEELVGVPVDMFSVGPKRSETIMRKEVF